MEGVKQYNYSKRNTFGKIGGIDYLGQAVRDSIAIDKWVAPYKNKKSAKTERKSGYWHYHLPNGGHHQPWFLAPNGYKIIK